MEESTKEERERSIKRRELDRLRQLSKTEKFHSHKRILPLSNDRNARFRSSSQAVNLPQTILHIKHNKLHPALERLSLSRSRSNNRFEFERLGNIKRDNIRLVETILLCKPVVRRD